jgi:cytochrome c oxidase subunit 2
MIEGWPPPIFDPAGPYAWPITTLSWALLALAAGVLLLVLSALYVALWGKERLRSKLGGSTVIWIGGIAFPVVVLSVLLVFGLSLTRQLSGPVPDGALRVRVTGEMWWWRIAYLDGAGRPVLHDANELHIPVGQPVVLELESADVIHSFWVPRLSGKLDMIPGRRNPMVIQADKAGVYGGQCAEYCGGPHALMGFVVVAHPPDKFEKVMQQRLMRTGQARTDRTQGRQLFSSSGCAACHRIAGTEANGLAGPDLTFVGSRRTLGAGILPNNRGTMMGWIANSQAIKPHNRMPPYAVLSGEQVMALAEYLEAQR